MKSFMFKKSSLAIAAALGGGLLAPQASAVNLATDGIGQVAIAPYYTVRDGWLTTINLINTQSSPIMVKVRIHEARNSRDVLDFDVGMSAFDAFVAVLREATDGSGPVLVVTDQEDADGKTTCTVPVSVGSGAEQHLSPLAFGPEDTLNDDGGPTGIQPTPANPTGGTPESLDRMREGYIEFIVMGYADYEEDGDVVDEDTDVINVGNAIQQHDCTHLQTAFSATQTNPTSGERRIVETAQQFGQPINALKFNFSLLNPSRGVEASNGATTWANFYSPTGNVTTGGPPIAGDPPLPPVQPNNAQDAVCTITRGDERDQFPHVNWVPDGTNASCRNLITAQTPFAFLEPTLNDAFPQVANWFDDARNFAAVARPLNSTAWYDDSSISAEQYRGVDAVSLTIQRSDILNEWSNNPTLGVTTDWIVTMPTKLLYVDGSAIALANSAPNPIPSLPPYGNLGPGPQSAVIPEGPIGGLPLVGAPASNLDYHNRPEAILADGDGLLQLPYAPFANAFGQIVPPDPVTGEPDRDTAFACNQVTYAVYDRAEQRPPTGGGDDVVVSPAPPPTFETSNLCYETNVISFNGQTALDSAYPLLDTAFQPTTVTTANLPAPQGTAGWMRLDLTPQDQGGLPAEQTAGTFAGNEGVARGLPVTGFLLKQRSFGRVTANFASSIDHGYMRKFEPPAQP